MVIVLSTNIFRTFAHQISITDERINPFIRYAILQHIKNI